MTINEFKAEIANLEETATGRRLWKLGKYNSDGYGCVYINGINKRANRLSYEVYNGIIPFGLLVLHRCDVPECVEPTHLFIGT